MEVDSRVREMFKISTLHGVNMNEISISEIHKHLVQGTFTCVDLTSWTLARIKQTNSYLHTITEVNPDALNIAQELDDELRSGIIRGPLHGIPVLVKDNMATADKMQTGAGSLALVGSKVPRDAHVVKLLREAGAVIIGHSSMCEWASMRSTSDSIGYSARGGQVRNPYNLSYSALGSSNGSACAVTAGIVCLALGSETDTSIIGPAYMTGLVGIKPTVGLTSRAGVVPISRHMDTVGPLTRNVHDAALALNFIVGLDPRDVATTESPTGEVSCDYTKYMSTKEALQGAVFGIPMKRVWNDLDPRLQSPMQAVLEKIKLAGAEIYEVDFPCWHEMISPDGWDWKLRPPSQSEFTVCATDFYNDLKTYLSELSDTSIESVEDVIDFNKAHALEEGASPGDNPAWPNGHDTLLEVERLGGVENDTYKAALRYCQTKSRAQGIDAALWYKPDQSMKAVELDALLIPDRRCAGQQLAAQAGYPIVCIPIGVDDWSHRPFGLSLHQTAWQEGKLIKYASAIEDLLGGSAKRPQPMYFCHEATNIPIIP